jgi:hypothetical protein
MAMRSDIETASQTLKGMQDTDIEVIKRKLAELQSEHRDLDERASFCRIS